MKKTLIISTLSLLGLIILPMTVGAISDNARQISDNAQQNRQIIEDRREEIKEVVAQKRETISNKLQESKLKACQNREGAINNIMSRISDRGTKQLNVFTDISNKVKAFYADKNLSLTNYDELVGDVDNARVLTMESISNAKGSTADFRCDGNDPKGFVNVFKNYAELQRLALKDHKTAVNNLIVAVKSVQDSIEN